MLTSASAEASWISRGFTLLQEMGYIILLGLECRIMSERRVLNWSLWSPSSVLWPGPSQRSQLLPQRGLEKLTVPVSFVA